MLGSWLKRDICWIPTGRGRVLWGRFIGAIVGSRSNRLERKGGGGRERVEVGKEGWMLVFFV